MIQSRLGRDDNINFPEVNCHALVRYCLLLVVHMYELLQLIDHDVGS